MSQNIFDKLSAKFKQQRIDKAVAKLRRDEEERRAKKRKEGIAFIDEQMKRVESVMDQDVSHLNLVVNDLKRRKDD